MKADVAIITPLADEFEAVLKRFSPTKAQKGSSGRTYGICQVKTKNEKNCTVALVRCSEQGSDASQQVTNDIIRDLDPYILLVVGIAGGVPDDEFTLGDVITSSRIHNLNVSALQATNISKFDIRGGIHPLISDIVASLPLYAHRLDDWNEAKSIGLPRPVISPKLSRILPDIDNAWQQRVRASLEWHFGKAENRSRAPIFKTGSIASSNTYISDPHPLIQWLQNARSILAVEMESAGVYQAAQQMHKQYPVMTIRGISDIVGLERDPKWVMYACETAASFAYAFVTAGIINADSSIDIIDEVHRGSVTAPPSSTSDPTLTPTESPVQTKGTVSEKTASTKEARSPIEVFISYSPRDENFLRELEVHLALLRRQRTINIWHSQYIVAGQEIVEEIDSRLRSAQLILLLISADFLASDFLYEKELSQVLMRDREGRSRIIPIILRPCDWQHTPIGRLVAH